MKLNFVSKFLVICSAIYADDSLSQGLPYDVEGYDSSQTPVIVRFPHRSIAPLDELQRAWTVAGMADERLERDAYREMIETEGDGWYLATTRPTRRLGFFGYKTPSYIEVGEVIRPDAAWLRIRFKDFELGGAILHVVSPESDRKSVV